MRSLFAIVLLLLATSVSAGNRGQPVRPSESRTEAAAPCACSKSNSSPIDMARAGLGPEVVSEVAQLSPEMIEQQQEKTRKQIIKKIKKMRCPKVDEDGEVDVDGMMEKLALGGGPGPQAGSDPSALPAEDSELQDIIEEQMEKKMKKCMQKRMAKRQEEQASQQAAQQALQQQQQPTQQQVLQNYQITQQQVPQQAQFNQQLLPMSVFGNQSNIFNQGQYSLSTWQNPFLQTGFQMPFGR